MLSSSSTLTVTTLVDQLQSVAVSIICINLQYIQRDLKLETLFSLGVKSLYSCMHVQINCLMYSHC